MYLFDGTTHEYLGLIAEPNIKDAAPGFAIVPDYLSTKPYVHPARGAAVIRSPTEVVRVAFYPPGGRSGVGLLIEGRALLNRCSTFSPDAGEPHPTWREVEHRFALESAPRR